MRMETPLGRVRGLGSAKTGAHHWWIERLTSVSTLILFIWFAVSLVRLPTLDHAAVVEWLALPFNAVAMLLLIISTFWHMKMGLQVVVEDYAHEEGNKVLLTVLISFATIVGAALAIFSVLKIAFSGDAA